MENYMDSFDTHEEYIRAEILLNRGTQSILMLGTKRIAVVYEEFVSIFYPLNSIEMRVTKF